MFERYTDRARRVVVLSQEEARLLSHNYIGTEHVVLGLIHEGEGIAARALKDCGVSLEAARRQVEEKVGRGQQSPPGHIPFTPRAKKVMELGLREALQLGHNYIGTEHLLLGLLRVEDCVGVGVLKALGADVNVNEVRKRVLFWLDDYVKEKERAVAEDRRASIRARSENVRLAGVFEALDGRLGERVVEHYRLVTNETADDLTEVLEIRWRR